MPRPEGHLTASAFTPVLCADRRSLERVLGSIEHAGPLFLQEVLRALEVNLHVSTANSKLASHELPPNDNCVYTEHNHIGLRANGAASYIVVVEADAC